MVETVKMEERKARQQKTVKSFVKGLGKKCSDKSLIKNGEINKEALLDALTLAFPDITPRTMGRNPAWNSTAGCVEFKDMPKELFKHSYKGHSFGGLLKVWFDTPCPADPKGKKWEEMFDKFHADACEIVIDFLETQLYEKKDITYGKAQKVVNMTFKHIYCLEGAYIKEEWFRPCHIALDSFTLEWFCRNVGGVTKGCVDSWSALRNVAEEIPNLQDHYAGMKMYTKTVDKGGGKDPEIHKFYTYDQIIALIRGYFTGDHPFKELFPLQAEFRIWPEIQLHLAAETLYGQDFGKEKTVAKVKSAEKEKLQKGEPSRWEKDKMDGKDFDAQYKWCKARFKEASLDDKMKYLKARVDELNEYFNYAEI